MYLLLHQYRNGGYRLSKTELVEKAAQEIVDMSHPGLVWLVHLEHDQKHYDILSEKPISKQEAASWFQDAEPEEINGTSELIAPETMQEAIAAELAGRRAFLFAEEEEEDKAAQLVYETLLPSFVLISSWTETRRKAEAESGDYILVSDLSE